MLKLARVQLARSNLHFLILSKNWRKLALKLSHARQEGQHCLNVPVPMNQMPLQSYYHL